MIVVPILVLSETMTLGDELWRKVWDAIVLFLVVNFIAFGIRLAVIWSR
jgi:hypothetical protein